VGEFLLYKKGCKRLELLSRRAASGVDSAEGAGARVCQWACSEWVPECASASCTEGVYNDHDGAVITVIPAHAWVRAPSRAAGRHSSRSLRREGLGNCSYATRGRRCSPHAAKTVDGERAATGPTGANGLHIVNGPVVSDLDTDRHGWLGPSSLQLSPRGCFSHCSCCGCFWNHALIETQIRWFIM
jgi:hypothetical protein